NLGGVLGGAVGVGIMVLAEPDSLRKSIALPLGFSVAGLVLTTFLTRNYDEPSFHAAGTALMEHGPGGWGFALPAPRLFPLRDGDGKPAVGLYVGLVGGTF
ncbi:MAG: hypothetical protein D6806_16570, partial [Deltaproteobacteria bacterium]